MKTSSLQALLIDRHCGELSLEVIDLLDHHLLLHAEARAEEMRILESLTLTENVVVQHPEIGQVKPSISGKALREKPRYNTPLWLARAAAVVLFAGLAGAGGFFAGRTSSSRALPVSQVLAANAPRKASPWTQYRMAFDASSEKLQVVRVDAPPSNP